MAVDDRKIGIARFAGPMSGAAAARQFIDHLCRHPMTAAYTYILDFRRFKGTIADADLRAMLEKALVLRTLMGRSLDNLIPHVVLHASPDAARSVTDAIRHLEPHRVAFAAVSVEQAWKCASGADDIPDDVQQFLA